MLLSVVLDILDPWFRKLLILERLHHTGIEMCQKDWSPCAKSSHLLNVLYGAALEYFIVRRVSAVEVRKKC